MNNDKVLCQLCGEPMPEGEEMFNYHGFSGPCPSPPLEGKPIYVPGQEAVKKLSARIEQKEREERDREIALAVAAFKEQAAIAMCGFCLKGMKAVHGSECEPLKDMQPPVNGWFHLIKAGEMEWTQDVYVHCASSTIRNLSADTSALDAERQRVRLEGIELGKLKTEMVYHERDEPGCKVERCAWAIKQLERIAALRGTGGTT